MSPITLKISEDVLSSPSTTQRKALSMATSIPLDSPSRTRPIHPDLPNIKVPDGSLPPTHYHPVTCEPFTSEDLQYHMFQALQKQYSTAEAAHKAQEEAIREVQARIEDSMAKTREVEKEMEEKEKMREVERKVYQNMKAGRGGTKI